MLVVDRWGRVLLVNPAAERMLGHSVEAILSTRALSWVHPEDRAGILDGLRASDEDGREAGFEARVLAADGSWVPLRWSLTSSEDGRMYGIGRDARRQRERRRAELLREAAELRLRTAMELHDGVLQTLTAAGLQIAAARKLQGTDPDKVDGILASLAGVLEAEQRALRLYVDEVKEGLSAGPDDPRTLKDRIEALLARVGVMWNVDAQARVRGSLAVGQEATRRVLRIVQEAAVNAARHGEAKRITIELAVKDGTLVITVKDDGTGFPFLGEFTDEMLRRRRLGPLSLKHRVAEAGGTIHIVSARNGARVTIRLPLDGEGGP